MDVYNTNMYGLLLVLGVILLVFLFYDGVSETFDQRRRRQRQRPLPLAKRFQLHPRFARADEDDNGNGLTAELAAVDVPWDGPTDPTFCQGKDNGFYDCDVSCTDGSTVTSCPGGCACVLGQTYLSENGMACCIKLGPPGGNGNGEVEVEAW